MPNAGARRGRRLVPLVLTQEERRILIAWTHRWHRTPARLAGRARIILAASKGMSNIAVSAWLRVSPLIVGRWRTRFLAHRIPGLRDRQRGRGLPPAQVE